jgi:hypothetical protein
VKLPVVGFSRAKYGALPYKSEIVVELLLFNGIAIILISSLFLNYFKITMQKLFHKLKGI